jgi:hypothetical protein
MKTNRNLLTSNFDMKLLLIALILVSTGCATRPADIHATAQPAYKYSGEDCKWLYREHNKATVELADYVKKQKTMHITDLATFWTGMFIAWPAIFVPIATPDYKPQIERLRGEIETIENVIYKECDTA